jgi:hypothetical protein
LNLIEQITTFHSRHKQCASGVTNYYHNYYLKNISAHHYHQLQTAVSVTPMLIEQLTAEMVPVELS